MSSQPVKSQTQPDGHRRHPGLLHRWVVPLQIPTPANPLLLKHAEERAAYAQNRLSDAITTFAGSMMFVYIHVLWFGCWIGFGVEKYPFGLLTMIVSLEAIFLSTFVLISQNRADARRQVISDQQWVTVQEEAEQNKQLLELSYQILALTKEVRGYAGFAEQDHAQNEELLSLTRRTLALTEAVHQSAGAGTAPDSPSGSPIADSAQDGSPRGRDDRPPRSAQR